MPQAAGDVIRQRRRERGLKVGELAASVEISTQHLDNIEAGRHPASIEVLYRIAARLGLNIDDVTRSGAA
jgi:transcriptional regulator with XRE-family HTH domain